MRVSSSDSTNHVSAPSPYWLRPASSSSAIRNQSPRARTAAPGHLWRLASWHNRRWEAEPEPTEVLVAPPPAVDGRPDGGPPGPPAPGAGAGTGADPPLSGPPRAPRR